MVILGQFQSAQVCSEEHESDSSFSSEISPTVGADMRIPRDKAAAPRSKTSTDMGSGSFTQSETFTADGSFSVVTVSSGSADSLPKRRYSDTSRARPRVSKGPFFFDEDDRHLNDTPVIAMDTEWGGEESSNFSSTTGSEEADFHANFCRFRGQAEILSLCRTKAQHGSVPRSARWGNGRDFVQSFGRIEAEARPTLPRR